MVNHHDTAIIVQDGQDTYSNVNYVMSSYGYML